MERDLRGVIGNWLILNSPYPPYFWVYSIFVDEANAQHVCTSGQIWLLIFGHFSNFLLICDFYFWKISPLPTEYMFQMIL